MTSPFIPSPVAKGWEHVAPAEAGFDAAKLTAATAFAEKAESPWPMSLYYPDGRYVGIVEWNEKGPWSAIVGPVMPRGKPAGPTLPPWRAKCATARKKPTHRSRPASTTPRSTARGRRRRIALLWRLHGT